MTSFSINTTRWWALWDTVSRNEVAEWQEMKLQRRDERLGTLSRRKELHQPVIYPYFRKKCLFQAYRTVRRHKKICQGLQFVLLLYCCLMMMMMMMMMMMIMMSTFIAHDSINFPCGKFGSLYLGKAQQPQEQRYKIHLYQCVQYLRVSRHVWQRLGFVMCAQMLVHAIALVGCTDTERESHEIRDCFPRPQDLINSLVPSRQTETYNTHKLTSLERNISILVVTGTWTGSEQPGDLVP